MPSLRDGVTRLGSCCVFLRTRSERRLLPCIYPSLLRDGVILWPSVVFSHSIETKSSLDSWSVFLQDGVTLFGSDSSDLISIEGITTVGLLGAFFRLVLGVNFCHLGVVRSALKSEGVPHSVVFPSGADCVCIPLANEGVGLGPSSPSGPVASRPPLAGWSASAV